MCYKRSFLTCLVQRSSTLAILTSRGIRCLDHETPSNMPIGANDKNHSFQTVNFFPHILVRKSQDLRLQFSQSLLKRPPRPNRRSGHLHLLDLTITGSLLFKNPRSTRSYDILLVCGIHPPSCAELCRLSRRKNASLEPSSMARAPPAPTYSIFW